MALTCQETSIPYIISFTIRADGGLVDGTPISEAIACIDGITEIKPVCYMTNCVHPDIVCEALSQPVNRCDIVKRRFLGIQANTAKLPYSDLDGSADLKTSAPEELARSIEDLKKVCHLKIVGGCCGTDYRHMEEIAKHLK